MLFPSIAVVANVNAFEGNWRYEIFLAISKSRFIHHSCVVRPSIPSFLLSQIVPCRGRPFPPDLGELGDVSGVLRISVLSV